MGVIYGLCITICCELSALLPLVLVFCHVGFVDSVFNFLDLSIHFFCEIKCGAIIKFVSNPN